MAIPAEVLIHKVNISDDNAYHCAGRLIKKLKMLRQWHGEQGQAEAEETLYLAGQGTPLPPGFQYPLILVEEEALLSVWSQIQDLLLEDLRIAAEIAMLYRKIDDMDLNEAARQISGAMAGYSVVILNRERNIVGSCLGSSLSVKEMEAFLDRNAEIFGTAQVQRKMNDEMIFHLKPIFENSVPVGFLMILSPQDALFDCLIVSQIGAAADLLAHSKRLRHFRRIFTREQLIEAVLDGDIVEPGLIDRLAQQFWHRPHSGSRYYLLTLTGKDEPSLPVVAEISNHLHLNAVMYRNYYLVMMICPDDACFLPDQAFLGFLKEMELQSVLSNSFENFSELSKAFHQCLAILDLRRRMGETRNFIRFQEQVGLYLIDRAAYSGTDLKMLCYRPVIAIIEYDSKYHTQYLHTLISYLGRNMSVQKTGSTLFEHRNTTYKKIRWIRETFQLDLNDFATQFKIHLTLCILYYLNMIDRKSLNQVMWDQLIY